MNQFETTANLPPENLARLAWKAFEPYHAMVYFASEAREAYSTAGLKGFWMGYFASRAAPLGPVSAEIVTAAFYNFHSRMVGRAIPDAWRFSTPERVRSARLAAADAALRRLLGEAIASNEVAEAAGLAEQALEGCDVAGRTLFASYKALDWPEEPHLRLWHAATLLREYRGDGHVAALLTEGLDGCEAHLTMIAGGALSREHLQPHRGWTDEEWSAARQRLIMRGWLREDGTFTPQGLAVRQVVEVRTDKLALPPWQQLGEEKTRRLLALVRPLSNQIVTKGGIPVPNPMGLPWP